MNQLNNHGSSLPHHRLLAYRKSLELLAAVRSAQIRDAKLLDEASRAAKGIGDIPTGALSREFQNIFE